AMLRGIGFQARRVPSSDAPLPLPAWVPLAACLPVPGEGRRRVPSPDAPLPSHATRASSGYHVNMPEYRRLECPGATIFFTILTFDRHRLLTSAAVVNLFRHSFGKPIAKHPFTIDAAVILPDHVHCIWTLPPTDNRFSMRWARIKGRFTAMHLA